MTSNDAQSKRQKYGAKSTTPSIDDISDRKLFKKKSFPNLTVIKEKYRVTIFGDAYVGKTELIRRFIDQKFCNDYEPTIEEFYTTSYDFKSVSINLEIVDTCGTEQFPAMRELNIKKSDLVILVYEVNQQHTIREVFRLYEIVREFNLCAIVIVGAKGDKLPDMYGYRDSRIEFLLQHTQDVDLYHTVCSAKESYNIERIFEIGFQSLIPSIDEIAGDLKDFIPKDCLSSKQRNTNLVVKKPRKNVKESYENSTNSKVPADDAVNFN